MCMDKSLAERTHLYNKKFKDMEWFNRKERLETTLTYTPTGETVKLMLEGDGGLNKDIRDIILFSGFDWSQGSLTRTPLKEDAEMGE